MTKIELRNHHLQGQDIGSTTAPLPPRRNDAENWTAGTLHRSRRDPPIAARAHDLSAQAIL